MMQEQLYLEQLSRCYKQYLKNIIEGGEFFPITLRGGKNRPENFRDLQSAIDHFQRLEKKESKKGWVIDWQQWRSKKVGNQLWPSQIRVETEEDYLALLQKEQEARIFKNQLMELMRWRPSVKNWLLERPSKVLELSHDWIKICSVVDYILQNPLHDHYLRGLPVPVHTKFIEQYESTILSLVKYFDIGLCVADVKELERALGLKMKPMLFTVRLLDNNLHLNGFPSAEVFAVSANHLNTVNYNLKEIWLVENETTLFMLPHRSNAIAIWTKGYALTELSGISILQKSKLFYWGDLDEDGFNMLNICRNMYPHVQSFLMDEGAVLFHKNDSDKQPAAYKKQSLVRLCDSEVAAFEYLREINGRIEQERLQLIYVVDAFNRIK